MACWLSWSHDTLPNTGIHVAITVCTYCTVKQRCLYYVLHIFTAPTSPEYHTFIEHFSELVSTLRNTDLYHYFVSKYVITLSDLEEINSASTPKDKIQVLLRKISSPLEAGYKKSFYEMLEIMKCHGNDATRTLSVSISSSLSMVHSDITGKFTLIMNYAFDDY